MKLGARRTINVIAVLLLCPALAGAQHFPSEGELTELIRTRVEENRSVGIVLGVMEADGSTTVVSYGEAGPDAKPLGPKSVFEIGSITKVFTGILLADIVAGGEVSFDDPVVRYLPDGATMPTRGDREITLLDLSTHHSGLTRLPENMDPADMTNPYADYTVEQMYEFLAAHELRRDIGAQYEYSNLGTGLLGHVLAQAAGSSYEDLVRERILEPLGMTMSGITLEGDMQDWMATGHDQEGNVVPLWDLPTIAGAGALRSNMEDMLTFLAANTGSPESQLERSMRDSHSVRQEISGEMGIGLNWHVRNVGSARIVWHNGGTGGFRTFIGFDPATGVGAVVLANSGHGADDIGFHLVNPAVPLVPAPKKRTEIELAEEILAAYVGEYELGPGFAIAITMEDGALFAQATGQGVAPIYPESETEFFLKVIDAQISFTRDDSGAVTGMILHQGGVDSPAPRISQDAEGEPVAKEATGG